MQDKKPTQAELTAAARDLVPLAKAILGNLGRMRAQGFVPLQPEQSAFFLFAAMAGVSHLLANIEGPEGPDGPRLIPSHMREHAYELAPEIARFLAEDVTIPKRPVGS
jgi:hypothetical protein